MLIKFGWFKKISEATCLVASVASSEDVPLMKKNTDKCIFHLYRRIPVWLCRGKHGSLSSLTKSNGLVFVPAPSLEDHHRGKGHERFLRDGFSNFLTQIHVCCANSFSSSKYTFDPIGPETTACIFFCLSSIVNLGGIDARAYGLAILAMNRAPSAEECGVCVCVI